MFLGLHPQHGDAGAPLVHVLQGVLLRVGRGALVRGGAHALHPLAHGGMAVGVGVRVGVGMRRVRRSVEEAVRPLVRRLEALAGAHEAGDGVDGRGAGERGRQPGVQGQGVAHGAHVGVHGRGPVEGEHGRVVELHGAGVHLLLPAPFCSAVLEPHLRETVVLQ